ncbi:maleylpyruvate isomerase family mycothiol-dependent enzyme [Asanoa sp. WMMD1127]|uniref:maleylpyruvate isomerase family mycothiol-dependent enzyme n=1 Tax=Asanoa sp. WMMD1127 TaxID=3016107 RepID=UPI0024180865|nr:maleylpyruvate isomerase family mycothiol-dependent enzyme [Asanoa sp. WMMD1127]MDG4822588.1 maleylpyruvate isomerase family mycothiol-dependent enzyme [Asanoa sp. WMMD1127]
MTRLHGTKDFWLGGLRAEAAAFGAAVAAAPPDSPVPSCPDWTVTDLTHHVGSVYEYVTRLVERGGTDRPDPREHPKDAPDGAAALAWWQMRYDALLSTLDAVDPEAPVWNWAPQSKKAGFWHRRMAHETAIHRWDAQMALAASEPIEAKLAADGISEVLDTWLPAGRRRAQERPHGVVHLFAADTDQEWLVRLRGEGVALLDTDTILDTDEPPARVQAEGTASDLLLALYGRVGFDVLVVSGDPTLLTALRTG